MNDEHKGMRFELHQRRNSIPLRPELWGHFLFFFFLFFFSRKSLWRGAPLSTSEVSKLRERTLRRELVVILVQFNKLRGTRNDAIGCVSGARNETLRFWGKRLNVYVKYQTAMVERSVHTRTHARKRKKKITE